MAETTKIQWCDHTASPWHGCSRVHAGCDNCYAEKQAKRNPGVLGIWGDDGTRVRSKSFAKNCKAWNQSAAERGVVESVFPSICDPFEDRPELVDWRLDMFGVIDECPNLRFLLLTKRPENIARFWGHGRSESEPMRRDNVWLGTSVSDQVTADRMLPDLLKCRSLSPVLFLSCEPLLGPIDLERYINGICFEHDEDFGGRGICQGHGYHDHWLASPDWIIVGGESGPQARPCNIDWVRSLIDQCRPSEFDYDGTPLDGTACFVKQLGSSPSLSDWPSLHHPKGGDPTEWPADLRVHEFPHAWSTAQEQNGNNQGTS